MFSTVGIVGQQLGYRSDSLEFPVDGPFCESTRETVVGLGSGFDLAVRADAGRRGGRRTARLRSAQQTDCHDGDREQQPARRLQLFLPTVKYAIGPAQLTKTTPRHSRLGPRT